MSKKNIKIILLTISLSISTFSTLSVNAMKDKNLIESSSSTEENEEIESSSSTEENEEIEDSEEIEDNEYKAKYIFEIDDELIEIYANEIDKALEYNDLNQCENLISHVLMKEGSKYTLHEKMFMLNLKNLDIFEEDNHNKKLNKFIKTANINSIDIKFKKNSKEKLINILKDKMSSYEKIKKEYTFEVNSKVVKKYVEKIEEALENNDLIQCRKLIVYVLNKDKKSKDVLDERMFILNLRNLGIFEEYRFSLLSQNLTNEENELLKNISKKLKNEKDREENTESLLKEKHNNKLETIIMNKIMGPIDINSINLKFEENSKEKLINILKNKIISYDEKLKNATTEQIQTNQIEDITFLENSLKNILDELTKEKKGLEDIVNKKYENKKRKDTNKTELDKIIDCFIKIYENIIKSIKDNVNKTDVANILDELNLKKLELVKQNLASSNVKKNKKSSLPEDSKIQGTSSDITNKIINDILEEINKQISAFKSDLAKSGINLNDKNKNGKYIYFKEKVNEIIQKFEKNIENVNNYLEEKKIKKIFNQMLKFISDSKNSADYILNHNFKYFKWSCLDKLSLENETKNIFSYIKQIFEKAEEKIKNDESHLENLLNEKYYEKLKSLINNINNIFEDENFKYDIDINFYETNETNSLDFKQIIKNIDISLSNVSKLLNNKNAYGVLNNKSRKSYNSKTIKLYKDRMYRIYFSEIENLLKNFCNICNPNEFIYKMVIENFREKLNEKITQYNTMLSESLNKTLNEDEETNLKNLKQEILDLLDVDKFIVNSKKLDISQNKNKECDLSQKEKDKLKEEFSEIKKQIDDKEEIIKYNKIDEFSTKCVEDKYFNRIKKTYDKKYKTYLENTEKELKNNTTTINQLKKLKEKLKDLLKSTYSNINSEINTLKNLEIKNQINEFKKNIELIKDEYETTDHLNMKNSEEFKKIINSLKDKQKKYATENDNVYENLQNIINTIEKDLFIEKDDKEINKIIENNGKNSKITTINEEIFENLKTFCKNIKTFSIFNTIPTNENIKNEKNSNSSVINIKDFNNNFKNIAISILKIKKEDAKYCAKYKNILYSIYENLIYIINYANTVKNLTNLKTDYKNYYITELEKIEKKQKDIKEEPQQNIINTNDSINIINENHEDDIEETKSEEKIENNTLKSLKNKINRIKKRINEKNPYNINGPLLNKELDKLDKKLEIINSIPTTKNITEKNLIDISKSLSSSEDILDSDQNISTENKALSNKDLDSFKKIINSFKNYLTEKIEKLKNLIENYNNNGQFEIRTNAIEKYKKIQKELINIIKDEKTSFNDCADAKSKLNKICIMTNNKIDFDKMIKVFYDKNIINKTENEGKKYYINSELEKNFETYLLEVDQELKKIYTERVKKHNSKDQNAQKMVLLPSTIKDVKAELFETIKKMLSEINEIVKNLNDENLITCIKNYHNKFLLITCYLSLTPINQLSIPQLKRTMKAIAFKKYEELQCSDNNVLTDWFNNLLNPLTTNNNEYQRFRDELRGLKKELEETLKKIKNNLIYLYKQKPILNSEDIFAAYVNFLVLQSYCLRAKLEVFNNMEKPEKSTEPNENNLKEFKKLYFDVLNDICLTSDNKFSEEIFKKTLKKMNLLSDKDINSLKIDEKTYSRYMDRILKIKNSLYESIENFKSNYKDIAYILTENEQIFNVNKDNEINNNLKTLKNNKQKFEEIVNKINDPEEFKKIKNPENSIKNFENTLNKIKKTENESLEKNLKNIDEIKEKVKNLKKENLTKENLTDEHIKELNKISNQMVDMKNLAKSKLKNLEEMMKTLDDLQTKEETIDLKEENLEENNLINENVENFKNTNNSTNDIKEKENKIKVTLNYILGRIDNLHNVPILEKLNDDELNNLNFLVEKTMNKNLTFKDYENNMNKLYEKQKTEDEKNENQDSDDEKNQNRIIVNNNN